MNIQSPKAGRFWVKRDVDRLWFKRKMEEAGFTLETLGIALAKETKRPRPLDKTAMSRRMAGRLLFKGDEIEALAHLLRTDVAEVSRRAGNATAEPPVVGTVDEAGVVDVALHEAAKLQVVRLKSSDGWADARIAFESAGYVSSTAPPGIYVIELTKPKTVLLCQFLSRLGKNCIVAKAFNSGGEFKNIPAENIRSMRRVVRISL